jgi:gliding motility-associated-like protein
VFSPNGDNINDTWNIRALKDFANCTVEIFNRWGQPIFRSNGYQQPWDGTYNGKPLPVATYYYIIDVKDGQKPIAGSVTILR